MKNLVFAFALLCSTSLLAQFSYGDNGTGTGIQSATNNASGSYSTAMGYNSTASGDESTAIGFYTTASGVGSTAMGGLTVAFGPNSTAMGAKTSANGRYSTAMGFETTANEYLSTAMGYQTEANGNASTAMGTQTTAFGESSTAMGRQTTAFGLSSTAMGSETVASGRISTAMGYGTSAIGFGTTAIGVYNKDDETYSNIQFSLQNTAFVIGNGTNDNNRSNALEVLFDGTTTIAGDLNINSDARLKANIISLGATLSKLLQIDGKTYTMKKDANHKKKIGLLAQDIEKVFPELVTETNDIKSVNYQGLVPVLINAMKEQDDKITKQQQEIDTYKKELDELKTMVKQLVNK